MHTINISKQKNMTPTPHSCKSSMNATRLINHKNNTMVVKIPIMIALSILFITLPYFLTSFLSFCYEGISNAHGNSCYMPIWINYLAI